MYKLTDRRLKKAEPILEKYRTELHGRGDFMVRVFERELRDCWGLGYQELKDIFKQLSKMARYRYLATYYMENSNAPTVASEFKRVLASLYGVTSRKGYDAPERELKREAFWEKIKARK